MTRIPHVNSSARAQGSTSRKCADHPRQKFVFNADDQSLRFHEDQTRCVSVAPETVPAGPWVKRALNLTDCDGTEEVLKRWTVVQD